MSFGLLLASFLARLPFCSNNIFTYDAADYLRAVRAGFWAQFVGSDSISLAQFYRRYISDSSFRHHPWGPLYAANAGAALRHFHVPLGFYIPALVSGLGLGSRPQLIVMAVISSLIVAVSYLILTSLKVNVWLAAIASLSLCFSPVLILAGTSLSPHPLFSLTSVLTLFALCKWIATQSKSWFALLLVGCALSIATLELSPLLVLTLLASLAINCWWQHRQLRPLRVHLRILALGIAAVGVLLLLIWPAGILQGGYLLSYGTFVYQGSVMHDVYFKHRGLFSSISRLGGGAVPGLTLVVFLIASACANFRARRNIALFAFTLFALLCFGQGIGNGFRNPTYASHAVLAISLAVVFAITALWSRGGQVDRWAAGTLVAMLAILTVAEATHLVAASPTEVAHDPIRVSGAIAALRQEFPPGTSFVVTQDPQAFILNAPEYHFVLAAATDSPEPQSWTPVDSYYLLVDEEEPEPQDVSLCDGSGLRRFGFAISCHQLKLHH